MRTTGPRATTAPAGASRGGAVVAARSHKATAAGGKQALAGTARRARALPPLTLEELDAQSRAQGEAILQAIEESRVAEDNRERLLQIKTKAKVKADEADVQRALRMFNLQRRAEAEKIRHMMEDAEAFRRARGGAALAGAGAGVAGGPET